MNPLRSMIKPSLNLNRALGQEVPFQGANLARVPKQLFFGQVLTKETFILSAYTLENRLGSPTKHPFRKENDLNQNLHD